MENNVHTNFLLCWVPVGTRGQTEAVCIRKQVSEFVRLFLVIFSALSSPLSARSVWTSFVLQIWNSCPIGFFSIVLFSFIARSGSSPWYPLIPSVPIQATCPFCIRGHQRHRVALSPRKSLKRQDNKGGAERSSVGHTRMARMHAGQVWYSKWNAWGLREILRAHEF